MDHGLELIIGILEILEIEVFIFPRILETLEISCLEILEIYCHQMLPRQRWYPHLQAAELGAR